MGINVEPLSPVIGAQISGANLSQLGEADFAAIEQALVDHQVIFFRDQPELAPETQIAFAERFGEEMAHREESVAALAALRERARSETVTLLCWEADGAMCHRTLLRAMVEGTPFPA